MQRQSAKHQWSETKTREVSGRKSPQKRPIWRRIGTGRFAETGCGRTKNSSLLRSKPPSRSHLADRHPPSIVFYRVPLSLAMPPAPAAYTSVRTKEAALVATFQSDQGETATKSFN